MRSKLQYPSFKFDNISKFQNVVSDRTLPPPHLPHTHMRARERHYDALCTKIDM